MTVTASVVARVRLSNRWMTTTEITGDNSYATGGEPLTANMLGLGQIDEILSIWTDTSAYFANYDRDDNKLKVYEAGQDNSGILTETVLFSACTDGGSTSGFKDFAGTIPAGSVVLGWRGVTSAAWLGDTSAVMMVGVNGDTDRFSAQTTGSVFTATDIGSGPIAADVLDGINAAITPRVTVTSNADFTNVTAGSTSVSVYYTTPTADTDLTEDEVDSATDLSLVKFIVTAIGI